MALSDPNYSIILNINIANGYLVLVTLCADLFEL